MGKVFDIQHFSTGDGPGIRTTVFFKGCPLHCLWCHNPESQSLDTQVFYTPSKCVGCRSCEKVCPPGKEIRHSIECAQVCPTGALELVGKDMTVQEVIEEVLKDKVFYDNSEGGITLSGGEPLYQPEFALDILTKAKQEGLHTAIETSGCGKTSDYIKLIPVTDLFLWDIKVMDEKLYHELVGGTLERVLENLRTLHRVGAYLRLRILFIPGIQDQPEILSATQALLKELEGVPYDVIPYHPLGNSKREKLALEKVVFPVPSEEQVADFYRKLQFSNP